MLPIPANGEPDAFWDGLTGLSVATIFRYVTRWSLGMVDSGTKWMVSVPWSMLGLLPCVRRPLLHPVQILRSRVGTFGIHHLASSQAWEGSKIADSKEAPVIGCTAEYASTSRGPKQVPKRVYCSSMCTLAPWPTSAESRLEMISAKNHQVGVSKGNLAKQTAHPVPEGWTPPFNNVMVRAGSKGNLAEQTHTQNQRDGLHHLISSWYEQGF